MAPFKPESEATSSAAVAAHDSATKMLISLSTLTSAKILGLGLYGLFTSVTLAMGIGNWLVVAILLVLASWIGWRSYVGRAGRWGIGISPTGLLLRDGVHQEQVAWERVLSVSTVRRYRAGHGKRRTAVQPKIRIGILNEDRRTASVVVLPDRFAMPGADVALAILSARNKAVPRVARLHQGVVFQPQIGAPIPEVWPWNKTLAREAPSYGSSIPPRRMLPGFLAAPVVLMACLAVVDGLAKLAEISGLPAVVSIKMALTAAASLAAIAWAIRDTEEVDYHFARLSGLRVHPESEAYASRGMKLGARLPLLLALVIYAMGLAIHRAKSATFQDVQLVVGCLAVAVTATWAIAACKVWRDLPRQPKDICGRPSPRWPVQRFVSLKGAKMGASLARSLAPLCALALLVAPLLTAMSPVMLLALAVGGGAFLRDWLRSVSAGDGDWALSCSAEGLTVDNSLWPSEQIWLRPWDEVDDITATGSGIAIQATGADGSTDRVTVPAVFRQSPDTITSLLWAAKFGHSVRRSALGQEH